MKLLEEFEVHETLNPKIWEDDYTLRPEVESQIYKIVKDFEKNVSIPFEVVDVHLVGSNASYNYTEHSDLDVHLVVNFDTMNTDNNLLQALFNLERSTYNKNHDISIHGVPVELYVEDMNSNPTSNGIYSLFNAEWIKKPVPITDVKIYDLSIPIEKWKTVIDKVLNSGTADDVNSIINDLYMIRKNSIAVDGEYGPGNQLFKEIRNLGLLDALKEKLKEYTSKELTLEEINK